MGGPQVPLEGDSRDRWPTRLVLGSPVAPDRGRPEIGGRGRIEATQGRARRVVVAMMPADTRRIAFAPGLPPARRGLVEAWRGQPAIKVNVVYDEPFWRKDGLSGMGLTDRPPIGVTFDNSPRRRIARCSARVPDRGRRGQGPGTHAVRPCWRDWRSYSADARGRRSPISRPTGRATAGRPGASLPCPATS